MKNRITLALGLTLILGSCGLDENRVARKMSELTDKQLRREHAMVETSPLLWGLPHSRVIDAEMEKRGMIRGAGDH